METILTTQTEIPFKNVLREVFVFTKTNKPTATQWSEKQLQLMNYNYNVIVLMDQL